MTLFDREMRRRLWHSIGILDMQTAFDRGSTPLLAADEFEIAPLNIDDAVLYETVKGPISEPASFTDMSFCSMTFEAMNSYRKLSDTATGSRRKHTEERLGWNERLNIVTDLEQSLEQRYIRHCDVTHPLQLLTKNVAKDILNTFRLLIRRPVHMCAYSQPPPDDNFDILEIGTEILENSLQREIESDLQQWSWLAWNKWFALAVVLAELCSQQEEARAIRAWKAAEDCFAIYPRTVADTASGLLWKPISKLMRKARILRQRHLQQINVSRPGAKSLRDSGSMNQGPDHRIWQPPDTSVPDYGSQSNNISTIPSEQNNYFPIGNEGISMIAESELVNESEMMSWINWEKFVDDIFEGDSIQEM